jgi:hypothetical protein
MIAALPIEQASSAPMWRVRCDRTKLFVIALIDDVLKVGFDLADAVGFPTADDAVCMAELLKFEHPSYDWTAVHVCQAS